MDIVIRINTDGDAFVDWESQETARVLRELADRIEGHPHFSPGHDQALIDINGNECGFLAIYDEVRVTWGERAEEFGDGAYPGYP